MKSLSPTELAGERRQVTALFYDVVGSTELLMRSDPEEFSRLLVDFHRSSEKVIRRNGGFLFQRLGDGGCSYFGFPEQSEDSAEKAVRAALELIDASGRRRTPPVRLRVGVATSLVVISSDGRDIIGTAPVLAARLQTEAEPNSVVVADSTYKLTRNRFDYHLLRSADLKGFGEGIPIWRPAAIIAKPDTPPAASNVGTPMRGRNREIARLEAAWKSVSAGNGRSIAILGDAGIGKSRLVAELRRRLNGGQSVVLQCHRRLNSQPLHPIIGFLEATIGKSALMNHQDGALGEALCGAGISVDGDAAALIAHLAREESGSASGILVSSSASVQALRSEVIGAAVQLLSSNASRDRLLIAVEDTQWADSMTMELLDRLSVHVTKLPILLLQTSRSTVSGPGWDSLPLSGLGTQSMSDLVASHWGGTPPPGLSTFVQQQCDGIPLYAEEMTLFLKTHQPSTDAPFNWRKLLSESGVSTLNDLLSARLADVGQARRTAQLASVIGREFSVALLRRLLDVMDPKALDADLIRLASSGVIERKDAHGEIYRFRHALLHEAAYGSLLRSDCRRLHQRIAQLLIAEDEPSLPAGVAAWQCAQAGLKLEAARFALKAAEAYVLHSALREADQLLELAAEQIKTLPGQPVRTGLLLDLLELQGTVSAHLEGEGSQKARKTYARAMSLMRRQTVPDLGGRFPLYWGWWFTAPNILTQQSRAHVLVEDMKGVSDPETRLQSYHCAWATGFHAAQHDFCLDCVMQGLALYDRERAVRNRALYGGHDARVCGLGESALSYLLIGQPDASERAIRECLDWADATDHIGSKVHALYYAVVLRRCQSRYDDVAQLAERMRSVAERHGLAASLARANMYGGWAEAMSVSRRQGAKRFNQGLELQQQIGTDENMSIHIDMQSEILQLLGRPAEAVALIDRAITLGRKSGQVFWLAELYRRRAKNAQMLGDKPWRVRSDLKRAVRTAEAQGAKWLAMRAEQDLRLHG